MNQSSHPKLQVVFVLGRPGAGKGTQCKNIVKNFGFVHLSAGELLRQERSKPGSEYGEVIDTYFQAGKIVPMEITCSLLQAAMKKADGNKFLIDGFPTNRANMDGWQKFMSKQVDLLFVLFLDCPQEICVQRCLNRGKVSGGRFDDNPDSLKQRCVVYQDESMPVIHYFEEQNLVKRVDASKPPERVFDDVRAIFENIGGTNS